jgi:hypothetical protein
MPSATIRQGLEGLAFTAGLEASQLDRLAELVTPVQWDAGNRKGAILEWH